MKTRTAAFAWALAGVLFASTAWVQLTAQAAPADMCVATVGKGTRGDTMLTLKFDDSTISVRRPAAPDPDAALAPPAHEDRDCPARGRSSYATLLKASYLLFGKVLPFVVTHFVGRA